MSRAESNSLLSTIFKTDLSTNAVAAKQLANSGIYALCDAYSKGVTTQQIADYLQCSLYAVLVYESGLKAEDKELLNQAKLQHAQLAKNMIASKMDAELDRLEIARELVGAQVGGGIASPEDKESVDAALSSESTIASTVLNKMRAYKIRMDSAESDINRYSKRLDESKLDTPITVQTTIIVADRRSIPAMPDNTRLLPEE